jgi:hypothetical protein
VNIPPRLSPNHQTDSAQTIDPASASLTVRRKNIPQTISSCVVANSALYRAMCCSMSWLTQPAELATTPGLPTALSLITWVTKNGVNM